MNVLVLNSGSSSLKFQVIDTDLETIEKNADRTLARGVIERIGSEALVGLRVEGKPTTRGTAPLRDHRAALDHVLRWLVSAEAAVPGLASIGDIQAVGHRVVHGGEKFKRSVTIDETVVDQIEDCIDLAPLHNPANLKGIYAAREILGPGIPQVAVFDTSFHTTMPDTSYLYAVPYPLYVRHRVRRYGFHGTSHRYVAYRYRPPHQEELRGDERRNAPPGQRLLRLRHPPRRVDQHVDGPHPPRGPGDGDARREHRPFDPRLPAPQGGPFPRESTPCSTSSRVFSASPASPTTCATCSRRKRVHQDRRARLAIEIFCSAREALHRRLHRADERGRRPRLHRRDR